MPPYALPTSDFQEEGFQEESFEDLNEGLGLTVDGDIGIIKLELTDGSIAPVMTHRRPHLDELCTIWLIKRYGTYDFVENHLEDGVVKLGIGHGRLDEHRASGKRMPWDCCATLVAKALGVFDDPCLKKILLYVRHRDAHAGAHPMEVEPLVKLLHRSKLDTLEILAWLEVVFDALYTEQMVFLTEGKRAFEAANSLIGEILGPNGMLIKLAVIHSEQELVSKYARAEIGGNCGVVIQVLETGHIFISGSKRQDVNVAEVKQILSYQEQEVKGKITVTRWQDLCAPGRHPDIPEWFLLGDNIILNSSLTVPGVPATKIPLEQIVKFVEVGINPRAFYPEHAAKCVTGWCMSNKAFPCPWYKWQLARCRAAREAKYKKIKEKAAKNNE